MNILCADKGCINIDEEVGSKEWEKVMMENDISESDIKILEEFINKVNSM